MKRRFLLTLAAVVLAGCGDRGPGFPPPAEPRSTWRVAPEGDVNAFFDCAAATAATVISAHRGGPRDGFPETALETFAATLAEAPAII